MDHDSMTGFKRVTNILQWQFDLSHFIRHKGLGIFVAVAEPTANDLAANHHLGTRSATK